MVPGARKGEREARWMLMDYLDSVLHVFTPELRERYRLEALWGEAERLETLAGRARRRSRSPGPRRSRPRAA